MTRIALVLLLLVLVGCAPVEAPAPALSGPLATSTLALPSATPTMTLAASPVVTATLALPSVTPTVTPSVTPVVTDTLLLTPYLSPTPYPTEQPIVHDIVRGVVTIEAAEPLPPGTLLVVDLEAYGIGRVIMDQLVVPNPGLEPVPFALKIEQPGWTRVGEEIPVSASLRIPGRVSWRTKTLIRVGDPHHDVRLHLSAPNVSLLTGQIRYPADFTPPPDAELTMRVTEDRGTASSFVALEWPTVRLPATDTIQVEYLLDPLGFDPPLTLDMALRAGDDLLLTGSVSELTLLPEGTRVTVDLARPEAVVTVAGVVHYTPTMSLPADAQLTIQLLMDDPMVADEGPFVVVKKVIKPGEATAIPFRLSYDPSHFPSFAPYLLVHLHTWETVLFSSASDVPGDQDSLEIHLSPADYPYRVK